MTPKKWRDMTPEEKGALLLAHHERRPIESSLHGMHWGDSPALWQPNICYRIKPPQREWWLAVDAAGHVHDAFDTAEQAHGRTGYLDCDIIKVVAE